MKKPRYDLPKWVKPGVKIWVADFGREGYSQLLPDYKVVECTVKCVGAVREAGRWEFVELEEELECGAEKLYATHIFRKKRWAMKWVLREILKHAYRIGAHHVSRLCHGKAAVKNDAYSKYILEQGKYVKALMRKWWP